MLDFNNLSEVNILIVDDAPPIVSILKSYLSKYGFQRKNIYSSSSYKEAFDIDKEVDQKFDIVFCDINLGPKSESSGFDVIRKFRLESRINKYASIVVITGDRSLSLLQKIKIYHPNAYLIKPFTYDYLNEILDNEIRFRSRYQNIYNLLSHHRSKSALEEAQASMSFESNEIMRKKLNNLISIIKLI
ncbi:response regulator [Vibrio coralliilyticus]|uniref:response regulator n=1 Tax=Vibrio coralliilyticus TaxID=190893 RepID=UPI00081087A7|nr:response regulator [Vibrio coralliilyticus]ANW27030.1 hypothetical protein BA953_23185 [Vibrio coralliilyticus]ARC94364.1 response regulator [Vibrio coralliilyticus]